MFFAKLWQRIKELFIEPKPVVVPEDLSKDPNPRLVIISEGIETGAGGSYSRIELDWNQAFITELRKNGFSAETEDEIIQQYIASLAHNSAQRLEVEGSMHHEIIEK